MGWKGPQSTCLGQTLLTSWCKMTSLRKVPTKVLAWECSVCDSVSILSSLKHHVRPQSDGCFKKIDQILFQMQIWFMQSPDASLCFWIHACWLHVGFQRHGQLYSLQQRVKKSTCSCDKTTVEIFIEISFINYIEMRKKISQDSSGQSEDSLISDITKIA